MSTGEAGSELDAAADGAEAAGLDDELGGRLAPLGIAGVVVLGAVGALVTWRRRTIT